MNIVPDINPGDPNFSGPINQDQGSGWSGVGSGALAGAGTGSMFGPWGTVVGAGVGAVAGLFGAKKQSDASTKSAQIQSDAATKAAQLKSQSDAAALKFQQDQAAVAQDNFIKAQQASYAQWAAREQRLAPFRSLGAGAVSTLGGLLGIQGAPQPGIPPPPQFTPSNPGTFGTGSFATSPDKTAQTNASATTFNNGAANIQQQINGLPQSAGAPPTPGGPGIDTSQYAKPVGGQSLGALVSPQGQAPANGAQTVLMRAPDGTTRQIPTDQVPHYEQLGATRVQ